MAAFFLRLTEVHEVEEPVLPAGWGLNLIALNLIDFNPVKGYPRLDELPGSWSFKIAVSYNAASLYPTDFYYCFSYSCFSCALSTVDLVYLHPFQPSCMAATIPM